VSSQTRNQPIYLHAARCSIKRRVSLEDDKVERITMSARNVLGTELVPCSYDPLTGFYRNGCCHTDPQDHGHVSMSSYRDDIAV